MPKVRAPFATRSVSPAENVAFRHHREPDVDLLFIGPADLSQSMGGSYPSPELDAAVDQIIAAVKKAGVGIGLFVGDAGHIAKWHALGVTAFVCGSDQALLRKSATQMMITAKIEKE